MAGHCWFLFDSNKPVCVPYPHLTRFTYFTPTRDPRPNQVTTCTYRSQKEPQKRNHTSDPKIKNEIFCLFFLLAEGRHEGEKEGTMQDRKSSKEGRMEETGVILVSIVRSTTCGQCREQRQEQNVLLERSFFPFCPKRKHSHCPSRLAFCLLPLCFLPLPWG